jgi:tetraacyldisaccharide 4'-kinase
LPWGAGSGGATDEVVLVTGIANAGPLRDYVRTHFRLIHHMEFSDHHDYGSADLEEIAGRLKMHPSACVVTTEKDISKLGALAAQSEFLSGKLFYVPIQLQFLKSGRDFDEMLLSHLTGFSEKNL